MAGMFRVSKKMIQGRIGACSMGTFDLDFIVERVGPALINDLRQKVFKKYYQAQNIADASELDEKEFQLFVEAFDSSCHSWQAEAASIPDSERKEAMLSRIEVMKEVLDLMKMDERYSSSS